MPVQCLAAALGACAALPAPAPDAEWQHRVDLPVPTVTALAAGALGHALAVLPPPAAGGPAGCLTAEGSGRVSFAQRGSRWVPTGPHRLRFDRVSHQVVAAPDPSLPPAHDRDPVRVVVAADGAGAILTARWPAALHERLADRLRRTFAQAADPDRTDACLGDPQLAAYVAGQLLQAAQDDLTTGGRERAERRLVRAAALGADGAALALRRSFGQPPPVAAPTRDPVRLQAWLRLRLPQRPAPWLASPTGPAAAAARAAVLATDIGPLPAVALGRGQ